MHLALTFFLTSAAIYWLHFLSHHARIAPYPLIIAHHGRSENAR